MKSAVSVVLCLALLAGCSWQSLNPFNWFGDDAPQNPVAAPAAVEDRTVLIPQILSARGERTPEGVIVHATGIAAAQGGFDAELRPVYAAGGGFSHLDFRIRLPETAASGPAASRAVVAATFFTRGEAAALGSVAIRAGQNSVTVSLR